MSVHRVWDVVGKVTHGCPYVGTCGPNSQVGSSSWYDAVTHCQSFCLESRTFQAFCVKACNKLINKPIIVAINTGGKDNNSIKRSASTDSFTISEYSMIESVQLKEITKACII